MILVTIMIGVRRMFEVTCKECGKKYQSEKNRDGYCEVCRSRRIAETKHKYYETRKAKRDEIRKKVDRCENCGKKFKPKKSDQKLCEECQYLKESNYRMTASNQYRKDHTDVIQFKVPKGMRADLKKYAADHGMNMTALIMNSIELFQKFLALPDDQRDQVNELINKKDDKK